MTKRKYRTDEERLSLIQECRLSGLTDKQWCETHQICPSNFYYQIQKFRKRACEIPESHSRKHPVPVPGKKRRKRKFGKRSRICVRQSVYNPTEGIIGHQIVHLGKKV